MIEVSRESHQVDLSFQNPSRVVQASTKIVVESWFD